MLTAMTDSERREIWIEAYRYFYLAYYHELPASALGRRWDRWASGVSLAIALTSSGSALSGWALWKTDRGLIVWSFLAGSASILSIAQSKLNVASRIRKQAAVRRKFARIRLRLQETLEDIIRGEELARIRK